MYYVCTIYLYIHINIHSNSDLFSALLLNCPVIFMFQIKHWHLIKCCDLQIQNFKKKYDFRMFLFFVHRVVECGACKRQPYGAKGVDLAVENWSKRCTPFALYIHQKVHTFCLQNWLKGVLAEKKKKKKMNIG